MQVLKTSCKPKTRARFSTVASCCFICLEVIMMKIPHFLQPFIPSQDMAWNRLAVSFGMFIVGIIFASWASRIPDVKAMLSMTDAELGFTLFATPIGQIPSMVVTPMLVKRFGSRILIVLATLGYATMLVALGFVTSKTQLFLVLITFGVFNNMMSICNNAQAVAVENLYRRSIMAKFHGCWSLGGVVGGLLGGLMAGWDVAPKWHFMVLWVMAVLIAYFCWHHLMKVDPQPQVAHTGLTRHRWVMPDALLIVLGIIGFGSMAVEGSMYDWNSVYFVSVLHEEGFEARFGYLACMIFMVSARFIADGFINRYGEVVVLRVSSLSMTVGLAMLVFFPSLWPAMIGSAFVGFGMAAVVPICFSMAGRSARVSASTAISMVTAISFLGFLLGPPVIGTVSEHVGLRGAFGLVMGAPLIVLILSTRLHKLAPKKIG